MSRHLIEGLDVNTFNYPIDFNQVKAAGKEFVLIRGGQHYQIDGHAREGFPNAYKAGFRKIGFWWYSYPHGDLERVRKEAAKAMEIANEFRKYITLPCYYDLENGEEGTHTPEFVQQCGQIWIDAVRGAGFEPGIYFNPSYYNRYWGVNDWLNKQGVSKWLAHWYVNNPKLDYDVHQYTDKGEVPGCASVVDLDRMWIDDDPPVPPIGIDPVILMAEVNKNGQKRLVTNWF